MAEEVKKEDSTDAVLNQLTPEEMYELQQYLGGGISAPVPEEHHNIHKFLHDVSISDDTTKTGFVTPEELGNPVLPVRTYKELALFSEDVGNMPYFADYFKKQSEIVTSTSLSKNAKLLELAVTSRRFIETGEKKNKKKNRGLFGNREKNEDDD